MKNGGGDGERRLNIASVRVFIVVANSDSEDIKSGSGGGDVGSGE